MERISESVETVHITVQQMRQALEDPLSSIRGASELLDPSHGSIAHTGASAERIDVAMRDLRVHAEQLRTGCESSGRRGSARRDSFASALRDGSASLAHACSESRRRCGASRRVPTCLPARE